MDTPKIKLEVSQERLNLIVQSLDTHVRQNGLQVAANVAQAYQDLQAAAKEQSKKTE